MKKLIPLLLLITSGCGVTFKIPPQHVKNCVVEFEHEISLVERDLVLYAVRTHIDMWESHFGRRTKPATIKVTHFLSIRLKKPGQHRYGHFRGVCYRRDNLIRVIAGRWGHVPALYHELCHLNIKSDPHHIDDHWDTWNDRARNLNQRLRSAWFQKN